MYCVKLAVSMLIIGFFFFDSVLSFSLLLSPHLLLGRLIDSMPGYSEDCCKEDSQGHDSTGKPHPAVASPSIPWYKAHFKNQSTFFCSKIIPTFFFFFWHSKDLSTPVRVMVDILL